MAKAKPSARKSDLPLYTEAVIIGEHTILVSAVTFAEALLVQWEGPAFMPTLMWASLRSGVRVGGTLPDSITLESLPTLPYMTVFAPLWAATSRVNDLALPGEATAAPGTVAA